MYHPKLLFVLNLQCTFGVSSAFSVESNRYAAAMHYSDVIMGAMASQITSLTIVYSTVYSGADQRKHHSSASLAFVRGIHRWLVNSPHKWPVTRKMFPFDDVIMEWLDFNCHEWRAEFVHIYSIYRSFHMQFHSVYRRMKNGNFPFYMFRYLKDMHTINSNNCQLP